MSEEMERIENRPETDIRGWSDASSAAPFISVMVLNYRYGDLLPRALEACAAQTFRDFEVVMINNGATDNTEEIWQAFCARHPEIRTAYVHVTPNQGPVHGWNEGLRRAQGEYVMFCDADDWMEPDCLERLAGAAMETGADRVSGLFQDVLPEGRIVKTRKVAKKVSLFSWMLQGVIFRRSVIVQNGLYFDKTASYAFYAYDLWYNFRFLMFEKNRSVVVDHTVYNYLINPISLSNGVLGGSVDVWMNHWIREPIEYLTDLKAASSDGKIQNEAEYLVVKSIYGNIMKAFRYQNEEDAKRFYRFAKAELDEKLPNWRKNPHLWPFGNGYELFESLCLYALLWMDRLHMMGLIRFAGKMSKHLKFTR